MAQALTGAIFENRRHFQGTTHKGILISGSVHFGRSWRGLNCKKTKQAVRVHLSDGRRAWGTYTDPKNVTLKINI